MLYLELLLVSDITPSAGEQSKKLAAPRGSFCIMSPTVDRGVSATSGAQGSPRILGALVLPTHCGESLCLHLLLETECTFLALKVYVILGFTR